MENSDGSGNCGTGNEEGMLEEGAFPRSVLSNETSYTESRYWCALRSRKRRREAFRLTYEQFLAGKHQDRIKLDYQTGVLYYDSYPDGDQDDKMCSSDDGTLIEEYSTHGEYNWINGKGGTDKVYFDRNRDAYTIRNWGGVHLTVVCDDLSADEVTRLTNIEVLLFPSEENE